MDLYKEILVNILAENHVEVTFPDIDIEISKLFEKKCFQALKKIKTVIEDDSLDDPDCFNKIEEIIRTLEALGSGGGFRHDF